MVVNTVFNNISAMSWRSVLFVEETGVPTDLTQVTDKFYSLSLSTTDKRYLEETNY
jgi:hypothetical protein